MIQLRHMIRTRVVERRVYLLLVVYLVYHTSYVSQLVPLILPGTTEECGI